MKLSVSHFDEEIRELENRIALERLALEDAVTGATDALRYTASKTVSSPKTLLALAGVGFLLGKFMFGKKAPPQHVIIPQKTGDTRAAYGTCGNGGFTHATRSHRRDRTLGRDEGVWRQTSGRENARPGDQGSGRTAAKVGTARGAHRNRVIEWGLTGQTGP